VSVYTVVWDQIHGLALVTFISPFLLPWKCPKPYRKIRRSLPSPILPDSRYITILSCNVFFVKQYKPRNGKEKKEEMHKYSEENEAVNEQMSGYKRHRCFEIKLERVSSLRSFGNIAIVRHLRSLRYSLYKPLSTEEFIIQSLFYHVSATASCSISTIAFHFPSCTAAFFWSFTSSKLLT